MGAPPVGEAPSVIQQRKREPSATAAASATATAVAVKENDRNDEYPYPIIVYEIAKTVVVHTSNLTFLIFEVLATPISYYDGNCKLLKEKIKKCRLFLKRKSIHFSRLSERQIEKCRAANYYCKRDHKMLKGGVK